MNNYCTLFSLYGNYLLRSRVSKNNTQVTYHSFVLLEWEHGKYCTVVEGAYMNGMGIRTTYCSLFETYTFVSTHLYPSALLYLRQVWVDTMENAIGFMIEMKRGARHYTRLSLHS